MNTNPATAKPFLPIWVWLIVALEVLMVSFFAIATAANPPDFLPNATELNYETMLYITRNLTAVLGLIIAVCLRSHAALLTMLLVRIVTDISDAISVFVFNAESVKSAVPFVVVLLIIIPSIAAMYLFKRIRTERAVTI